jgi:hypothetical protein
MLSRETVIELYCTRCRTRAIVNRHRPVSKTAFMSHPLVAWRCSDGVSAAATAKHQDQMTTHLGCHGRCSWSHNVPVQRRHLDSANICTSEHRYSSKRARAYPRQSAGDQQCDRALSSSRQVSTRQQRKTVKSNTAAPLDGTASHGCSKRG